MLVLPFLMKLRADGLVIDGARAAVGGDELIAERIDQALVAVKITSLSGKPHIHCLPCTALRMSAATVETLPASLTWNAPQVKVLRFIMCTSDAAPSMSDTSADGNVS